jgi:nitrogen fixation protein FixH
MTEEKKRSFWGVGVFVFYGLFIVFILAMVLYASIQDVQLVEGSYYEKGLAYQDRIDRRDRSGALEGTLEIAHRVGEKQLVLSLPAADSTVNVTGRVHLLRPSNVRLDRYVDIALDANRMQVIDTRDLARGLWLIEVDWKMDSEEYYTESRIVIP